MVASSPTAIPLDKIHVRFPPDRFAAFLSAVVAVVGGAAG
jgi:hypothetical protein